VYGVQTRKLESIYSDIAYHSYVVATGATADYTWSTMGNGFWLDNSTILFDPSSEDQNKSNGSLMRCSIITTQCTVFADKADAWQLQRNW
jgi:hypothetical protein